MGALTIEELSIGAPIQGATYYCPTPGGIRFAQTPRLLSGDAFSVMNFNLGQLLYYCHNIFINPAAHEDARAVRPYCSTEFSL